MTAHFRPFCWPFGVGNPPIARLWSGAGAFDGISGLCLSLFCRRASRSRRFPVGFSSRDFLHTKICVQMRVKLPPAAYAPGFGQIAADGRRSERRRRVPVPHALTLEDCRPLQRRYLAARRRGRRAPKGADGAHGAASGARTARGREADRRDSGDGRARAPRATDFGQRPKDAGGCAPAPAKISAWVRPRRGSTTRGRGERPVGAAGEGERPEAKQNASAPPHADQAPRGRQRKRPEASRGRAGRTHRNGGKPVTRTRNRARPAAKPTRPTTERRPAGAGATAPHHAHQRRRDHASGRRNGGEAGGDGAGRAALGRESQPPLPCHQRRAPH